MATLSTVFQSSTRKPDPFGPESPSPTSMLWYQAGHTILLGFCPSFRKMGTNSYFQGAGSYHSDEIKTHLVKPLLSVRCWLVRDPDP